MENNVAAESGTQQLGDSLLKENLINVEFGEHLLQRYLKKIGEAPKPQLLHFELVGELSGLL